VVGRIVGAHGVCGWVKVHSYTQPMENILTYSPWYLRHDGEWQARRPEKGRRQGRGVVAQIAGCGERDAALSLRGCDIAVRREQLPPAAEDEYYWNELIGLEVVTTDGRSLGRVDHLLQTGANDVLVVRGDRERLLPFIETVVLTVDLETGCIEVDWDPEF